MEEIIGKLKVVIFHNSDNLYSVIKVELDDAKENKYLTLTGNFPIPKENVIYKYKGEYKKHPRFGMQFLVSEYEEILPNSEDSIVKYLSGPLFPKIGLKTAQKIFNIYGEKTIELIKENPNLLDNVVSKQQKEIISSQISKESYFDEAVKMFVTYGLSVKMLIKIQSMYKDKMIQVIKENPYQLIEDIDGIGFKVADEFALKIGFDKHDEKRIKACIIYSVATICYEESNTYTDITTIKKYFKKIIADIDDKSLDYFIKMLIMDGKLFCEEDKIFSINQYIAENENAKILSKFIKRIINKYDEEKIQESILKLEKKLNIKYDEDQKKAIRTCLNSGVSIITGGPGTGKTTIINAIINVYKNIFSDSKIHLCAPTGRASKRLTEITGIKATTIHSLLKWDLHLNTFSVNEENPLEGDLLIIDEFSMVDNYLFHQLLRASQNIGQIIIIGDDDQLPSVSPGNVLKDLIESGLINTIKLNNIYRQSQTSKIISLAHHIKNNEPIIDDFQNDVIFYNTNEYKIRDVVLEYIKIAKQNGYEDDDIQILAPMYQGINGIDNFNEILQEYFNPADSTKKELRIGHAIYRENDKILQLKNQNEDNVFNGDIGYLLEISKDSNNSNTICVDYDSNVVEYTSKDFVNITHAYCISVHKSQGSEYPCIILPITFSYQKMLVKNLLYTAVTRAKQKLIIIGDYNAFLYGVNNEKYKVRKTTLQNKLLKYVNPL